MANAKGMTTNDIESHMRELYDIEISDEYHQQDHRQDLFHCERMAERPVEEEIYAVVLWMRSTITVRNEGRIVNVRFILPSGLIWRRDIKTLGTRRAKRKAQNFGFILNGLKIVAWRDILIVCGMG